MTDFKAKMHQLSTSSTNSISAGALPQTPLGELTALPQTPSWIWGAASRQWEGLGWGRGGKAGGEGEGGGSGGEGKGGPQVTVEPGPLRNLLRHC